MPAETTAISVSSLLSPFPFAPQNMLDPKPTGNFAVYLAALRAREAANVLLNYSQLPNALYTKQKQNFFLKFAETIGLIDLQINEDNVLKWLERNTSITLHPSNTVWIIEVRHQNPKVALEILTLIHQTAERRVREEMENMVARRISWLNERVAAEPDSTIRSTLYDLIGQAQKHAAILASDSAIAARLVSAPAVENQPSHPNRLFLIGLSLLSSIIIATATSALTFTLKREQPQHPQVRSSASSGKEVFYVR